MVAAGGARPKRRAGGPGYTVRQLVLSSARKGAAMFEGLFQLTHLILVLAIALIVFGPGKLPDLGKVLGESIRELKKALNEGA